MSFRFRHFDISDDRCAMKVGTDGVLLGSWADVSQAHDVLDVGTGSGLIAIMLAQRFPQADITGVELEPTATKQAAENMAASPWADRLRAVCADFLTWHTPVDAIVCNPPFFDRSLRCPDAGRSKARHTDTLPFDALAAHAAALLRGGGVFAVVLPADVNLHPEGMMLRRRCWVHTVAGKQPKRQLLEFVKGEVMFAADGHITLSTPDGRRTAEHQKLTRDFYLY